MGLHLIRAYINMHCRDCGYENEPTARFCGQCGADLFNEPLGASLVGTTILGRYRVRKLIAAGGMGVVYEAEQSLGDQTRTVAIKVLLPELSHDQTVLSRFTRECEIVAQLSHQNTVRVYDFGTTEDGTLFIAMEYVRGQSLADALRKGPMPVNRALAIIEQMCNALHEAHELGIVHRDLKPDNVMLARLGTQLDFVKILDFGIAVRSSAGGQHVTKLTQKGMILGTPPYMSPEQFTGAPIKRQSDIYSLGIILYEVLTGRLPFEADSPWEWAQRHLTATPPDLPSTMPSAVVNTVRVALAKDPAARPATTLEFFRQLESRNEAMPELNAASAVDIAGVWTGHTQPDAFPPSIATARDTFPTHETTARDNTPNTETTTPRVAATRNASKRGAPLGSTAAIAIGSVPQVLLHRRSRNRPWTAALLTLLGLGLFVFAGWIAYWYDWIEIPFGSNPPPLPVGLEQSSTASAYPSASTSSESAGYSSASDLPLLIAPVTGGAAHAANRENPASRPSTVASGAPAASQVAPASSGINWPANWPSIPSGLPSLPTALPPLPSAILGIPLPSIFQVSPGSPPSASGSSLSLPPR
jgi:serine/threonine protein kinase